MKSKRSYKDRIDSAVRALPFAINPDVRAEGRPPTQASSEFLTNKEQGDWAEELVFAAINKHSANCCAKKYGMSNALAAGDEGFAAFYEEYQGELNTIGKRPDLLIYRRGPAELTAPCQTAVSDAIAGIEVRSSSFLSKKYASYMEARSRDAVEACKALIHRLLEPQMKTLLAAKSPAVLELLETANPEAFTELDFRLRSWSSTPALEQLSDTLRELKSQIKILHKRDYLSITPKVEDIALVNRWVQTYNVPHYYLQVFFDRAYLIPFSHILNLISDPDNEGSVFSIEKDLKNQGKTTIKINVAVGTEVIGKIEMPTHQSAMKELDRGRLLFYVTFAGGHGYLDNGKFEQMIGAV